MLQEQNNLYEFGGFSLDAAEHALYRNGERIALAPKALETLLVLVRNAGHVVSKERLLLEVWPGTFVEEGNLNVNIFALRKALGDSGKGRSYIETVPRRGFLFDAPVQIAVRGNAPVVVETRTRARIITEEISETPENFLPRVQALSQPALPRGLPSSAVPGRLKWLVSLVGLAVLSILLAWNYISRGVLHDVDSIAVLPVVNGTSDANLNYLSEGLTEGFIASLSELPHLRVISRSTAYHYLGRDADPATVGRDLNVRAVLIGRMAPLKDGISLQLELVDVKDHSRIWGQRYDRRIANLPSLQDEVAYEIASRLRLNQRGGKTAVSPARHGTEDPGAYQLYLQGRFSLNQLSPEGFAKSAEYFHQAVQKDPHYALAYDGLADYYARLPYAQNVAPNQAFPRSKEYALKALELDGNSAEAHNSLATIREDYDWDLAGAEQEYRRALSLNPNYSTAYEWYGHYLSRLGRHEESLALVRQGLSVDPLSVNLNIILANSLYFSRRYEEAIQQCAHTLDLDPQFAYTHFLLGLVYHQQGKDKESIAEFKKAGPAFDDDSYVLGYLGKIYAEAGDKRSALKNLKRIQALSSKGYTSPVASAMIYFGLRDADRGFAEMEKAYVAHDPYLLYIKVDPAFDPVRSDPRFQDLLRRVGL
jgi:DNA-binding winged helix-turn-helix (wHTH) protein/TolB-like protein/Tfp pilus assembly protein PilF